MTESTALRDLFVRQTRNIFNGRAEAAVVKNKAGGYKYKVTFKDVGGVFVEDRPNITLIKALEFRRASDKLLGL